MVYIGMPGPKGYGFSAVLVINRVSTLAILVSNRVWFFHCSHELGMSFRRSYFFIISDKTIIKSPSYIMFRATVPTTTVINRVGKNRRFENRVRKPGRTPPLNFSGSITRGTPYKSFSVNLTEGLNFPLIFSTAGIRFRHRTAENVNCVNFLNLVCSKVVCNPSMASYLVRRHAKFKPLSFRKNVVFCPRKKNKSLKSYGCF